MSQSNVMTKNGLKVGLLGLILVLILLFSLIPTFSLPSIPTVRANALDLTPYTVQSGYPSGTTTGKNRQDKVIFHAVGRLWCFYLERYSTPGYYSTLFFQTSTDNGETWGTQISIGSTTYENGHYFSLWQDEIYLYMAYQPNSGYSALRYKRATLNIDGTVTFAAVTFPYTVDANDWVRQYLSVAVDAYGCPWIIFNLYNHTTPDHAVMIIKSSTNDGTWSTALTQKVATYGSSSSTICTSINPLANGDMVFTYQSSTDGVYNSITYFYANSSFGAIYQIATNTGLTAGRFSTVASGNTLYFAFLDSADSYKIKERKYDSVLGWDSSDTVITSLGTSGTSPMLSVRSDGITCFFLRDSNASIYDSFMSFSTGSWYTYVAFIESLTLTSIDEIASEYSYNATYPSIGFIYETSTTNYKIRYANIPAPFFTPLNLSSITPNTPISGSISYNKTVNFVFTPIWTGNSSYVQNATLYINGTTEVKTYPSLVNDTQNTITLTLPTYASYTWYVRLYNMTDYIQSSSNTLDVLPSILKTVVLITPAGNAIVNTKTINFIFTPTWNFGDSYMRNATLYVNGVKTLNQSILVNATTNTIAYTVPIYASYTWYVRLYNSTSYIQSSSRLLHVQMVVPPPPSHPLWPYIVVGDLIGLVIAVYATTMGAFFFAALLLIFSLPLYIRTQSLTYCVIVWVVCSGLVLTLVPLSLPATVLHVISIFIVLAVGGILYTLFGRLNR